MASSLYKLMNSRKEILFSDEQSLSFEDLKLRLNNIHITDSDTWIRLYKKCHPNEISHLRNYYINRIAETLSVGYSLYRIHDDFTKVWQYYKPLEDSGIKELLLKLIEKSSNEDDCDTLHKHINCILEGEILTSDYAKHLCLSIIKTYLYAAEHLEFPTLKHGSMNTHLNELDKMIVNTGSDFGIETSILALLDDTIPTFELLMRNMNQQDSEFIQLLLSCILEQELLHKYPHLSKYAPAVSLLNNNMSVQEIVDVLNVMTSPKTMEPETTLPEFFMVK